MSQRNLAPIVVVCLRVVGCIALITTVFTIGASLNAPSTATTTDRSSVNYHSATQQSVQCPTVPPTRPEDCGNGPCVVDIKESVKAIENPGPFDTLKQALERPNTTVRIGPEVELDFEGLKSSYFPLLVSRCVTLMSVASFEAGGPTLTVRKPVQPTTVNPPPARPQNPRRKSRTKRAGRKRPGTNVAQRPPRTAKPSTNTGVAGTGGGTVGPIDDLEVERPPRVGSARTPKSRGPIFRFGSNPGSVAIFLELRCDGEFAPDGGNGVRISGFRLYGKSFGQQSSSEIGIQNKACVNVEISNMEIAGWGGSAIKIVDDDPEAGAPPGPAGRITSSDQVRVFGNYIHHNQHHHEQGYGVNVGWGAYAQISHNLFDHNRHAITASGDAGGYVARYNLVLKGGGIHARVFNYYTHQFDVHGDKNCGVGTVISSSLWNCGHASYEVVYDSNAFQFRNDHAIKIRGKPRTSGLIANNVFPHDGFEDDSGDDAVALYTTRNMTFSSNEIEFDSFGKYGVCDFDADGIDDLFLATGASWWYSSFGEFPWSYMSTKRQRPDSLRFGYVDNDLRCDVLTQRDGQLIYSSGGYGDWQSLGRFDAPLKEVTFGRFDPAQTDSRPGATRITTHAFWQRSDTQWVIVPLASLSQSAAPPWQAVASSGKKLKFGDFTGDGVTDVLAVVGGRWQISRSGLTEWQPLNPSLGDSVDSLQIANMDTDDNIDDILKLERKSKIIGLQNQLYEDTTLTWWRSKNGNEPWKEYSEHHFRFPLSKEFVSPRLGFVGRFGASPGGGTLVIGNDRVGVFYSEAETLRQRDPLFQSVFAY